MENPITGEVEGFSVAEQMDLAQILKAKEGDVNSYKTIMDRLEGKPRETIDQNSTGEITIKIKTFNGDNTTT
jgi:hypothetical protein